MDEIFLFADTKHLRLGRMIASKSLRGGQVLWYTVITLGREIQGCYLECYERFVFLICGWKFMIILSHWYGRETLAKKLDM